MKFLTYLILVFVAVGMTSCKSPQPRKPVVVKTNTFFNESIERNKQILGAENERIKAIIEKDSVNTYFNSENGFWYYYNEKIDQESRTPLFGDIVTYTYDISDLNGKMLYSKADLGPQRYTMDQEELFSGLREGLKLMKAGESVTFLFPSQKAFGFIGDNNRIGMNVPLMCNVIVNSVQPNNN